MNHVVISPGPGEIGYGCKCGKRFATQKTADLHAKDQNLIEENEAKAKKAEGQGHRTGPPGARDYRAGQGT
jgi:hypothetical protein